MLDRGFIETVYLLRSSRKINGEEQRTGDRALRDTESESRYLRDCTTSVFDSIPPIYKKAAIPVYKVRGNIKSVHGKGQLSRRPSLSRGGGEQEVFCLL